MSRRAFSLSSNRLQLASGCLWSVYMGLAGSLATGGTVPWMVFLSAFGVGTLLLMLVTSLMGRVVRPGRWCWSLGPVGLVLLGILLVLRELALDLPLVSLVLQKAVVGRH